MATVVLRYWAAAKEAAGVPEDKVTAATLAEALDAARGLHVSTQFARVVARSSFLVDGSQAGHHDPGSVSLADGAVVEVLPAFAGG